MMSSEGGALRLIIPLSLFCVSPKDEFDSVKTFYISLSLTLSPSEGWN
jgi:hypothetical protein